MFEDVQRRIAEMEGGVGGALPGEMASQSSRSRPNKPKAITVVLKAAGRPLKSREIYEQLIEWGWIDEGPKAQKRFYSTMTRLKGEGRLIRRADGAYELPVEKRAFSGS